jgi:thiol-disulfide isomerase/thioredoxin
MVLGASLVIQSAEAANATVPGDSAAIDPDTVAMRDEQLRNLTKEVDDAERAYLSTLKADKSENQSRWHKYTTLNATNVPAVMQLASQGPVSSTTIDSLVWVVTNRQVQGGSQRLRPYGLQAVELLAAHHYATNPAAGPVCWGLASNWDFRHQPSVTFLEEVISKNPDHNVRAYATYALAKLTKRKAELLSWLETTPEFLPAESQKYGVEEAKKGNMLMVLGDAERLYESVLLSYSNCPAIGKAGLLLGQRATEELYEVQHLWRGKVAPQIDGEDLDGRKMKLSDYRGKVVLLSFWGSWCGPCMGMLPFEQKLAERMAGRPFALVGVNSDVSRADAAAAVEREKLTWPSFWCGTNGTDGKIPTSWNITGWPTVYVLDPKGAIQLMTKGFGGTNTEMILNATVDRLLNEPQEKESKVE